jgi:hypothetical protein
MVTVLGIPQLLVLIIACISWMVVMVNGQVNQTYTIGVLLARNTGRPTDTRLIVFTSVLPFTQKGIHHFDVQCRTGCR